MPTEGQEVLKTRSSSIESQPKKVDVVVVFVVVGLVVVAKLSLSLSPSLAGLS